VLLRRCLCVIEKMCLCTQSRQAARPRCAEGIERHELKLLLARTSNYLEVLLLFAEILKILLLPTCLNLKLLRGFAPLRGFTRIFITSIILQHPSLLLQQRGFTRIFISAFIFQRRTAATHGSDDGGSNSHDFRSKWRQWGSQSMVLF
jgi:hypothetical protein